MGIMYLGLTIVDTVVVAVESCGSIPSESSSTSSSSSSSRVSLPSIYSSVFVVVESVGITSHD